MAGSDGPAEVTDNPAASRFEVSIGGRRVGLAAYRQSGATVTLTHTEIDDGHEGQGLASSLVKGALDLLRERGAAVVPECSFVRSYIQRHHEYLTLVKAADRQRFSLPGPSDSGSPNG